MDFVERATKEYLESLGLGEVIFEPSGPNTFPDFSIGERIGVECTRLVHIVEKNGREYNLDQIEPSIIRSLEAAFKDLPRCNLTHSYFVCLDFDIDIELRIARRKLTAYLSELSQTSAIIPHRQRITNELEIEILKSSNSFETPFVLGGMNTRNSAGWVLEQLSKQTQDAIKRKTEKLVSAKELFGEWWLAVSGGVAVGVSESYAKFIENELRGTPFWDRVLLINPHSYKQSKTIEIKRP
ncbi:hypothetical protein [Cypionkella psychrotolerans]|uniref:hypothetical protein n=1 Tax=Cypionkella psychrotolerans TaxID=1678131 RepID=UPI0006B61117|nr:hypothetical protein [Cypionkella psychrotolerans]